MTDSIAMLIQRVATLATFGGPGGALGGENGPIPPEVTNAVNGAAQQPQPQGNILLQFLPLIAIFIGVWCLMILPQRRRDKKMKEMQASIKTGDSVVTSSGVFGRVADVGTDCFVIEMGISGRSVKVPILKSDVLGVRDPVLTPPPKEIIDSKS